MTEKRIREIITAFEDEYTEGTIEKFNIWPREFDMGDGKKPCTVMIELASKYDHTDERYKKWGLNLLSDTDGTLKKLQDRLNAKYFVGGTAGYYRLYFEFYIENFER